MTSLTVLARVLVAVGQALQEAEPDQPAQGAEARKAKRKAAPETTSEAAPPSAEMNWEDLVEPCSIAEATRATELLKVARAKLCLLYTSPSPRDLSTSRMPSSA